MQKFKDLLLEKTAKKSKAMQDLTKWVEIMYPEAKITDNPKDKTFGHQVSGSTSYSFKSGKEAKAFLDKMSAMPKFSDLLWLWSANSAIVAWPLFSEKVELKKDDFLTWSIDTRPHGSIEIKNYKALGANVSFIYKDGKQIANYNHLTELLKVDAKNLSMFKGK